MGFLLFKDLTNQCISVIIGQVVHPIFRNPTLALKRWLVTPCSGAGHRCGDAGTSAHPYPGGSYGKIVLVLMFVGDKRSDD